MNPNPPKNSMAWSFRAGEVTGEIINLKFESKNEIERAAYEKVLLILERAFYGQWPKDNFRTEVK